MSNFVCPFMSRPLSEQQSSDLYDNCIGSGCMAYSSDDEGFGGYCRLIPRPVSVEYVNVSASEVSRFPDCVYKPLDSLNTADIQKKQTFDFSTAVKHLQDGKSVRCVDWKKDIYIRSNSDGIIRHFSSRTGRPVRITFTFFVSHFISDWELYNG